MCTTEELKKPTGDTGPSQGLNEPPEEPQVELVAIRRSRLKEWFANRTLPVKERSYLSQLIRGKVAFGGRAARRLEKDYRMPAGHLDGEQTTEVQPFGERIRQLRKEGCLTQQQLADYVGVSASAVGNWESGRRSDLPKGDHLLMLAEAFGIDPVELMGTARKSAEGSTEEARLLAVFRVLSKERQLIAIKLLEALK